MQTITVNLNLSRGSCRINQPLYLGETVALSFSESGAYSLILTEPFADSPKDGIVVWAQSTATGELSLNRKALHSAFKKAEAMQPNMTISAKCFVISEDGQTVADGEVAIEYSPKAFVIDDEDYPLAREVLTQATSAKNQAIAAKDSAIAAKAQAESAQSAAEEAKDKAVSESKSATIEREKAQQAATIAAQHATIATSASSSALEAQTGAEEAQRSAETAASAAQVAKDEAQGIANETALQQVEKVRQELLPLISAKANSAEFDKVVEKIATLIGNDNGYSVRQIAAELIAEVVSGADKNFDTLKEIADWILNDTTGAAALANAAEDLKNKTLDLENNKADKTALETEVKRATAAEEKNAKAIGDEEKRAQEAESALAERVKELEENPSVEVVAPDSDATEGQAADAAKVYEALGGKVDAEILSQAVEEIVFDIDGIAFMDRYNNGNYFFSNRGYFGENAFPADTEEGDYYGLTGTRICCNEVLDIHSYEQVYEDEWGDVVYETPYPLTISRYDGEGYYLGQPFFVDGYGTTCAERLVVDSRGNSYDSPFVVNIENEWGDTYVPIFINPENGLVEIGEGLEFYHEYDNGYDSLTTMRTSIWNTLIDMQLGLYDEWGNEFGFSGYYTKNCFLNESTLDFGINPEEQEFFGVSYSNKEIRFTGYNDLYGWGENGDGAGDICDLTISPIYGIEITRWDGGEEYHNCIFNPFLLSTRQVEVMDGIKIGDTFLNEENLLNLLALVVEGEP